MSDNEEQIEEPEETYNEEVPPEIGGYGRRAFDISRKRFARGRGASLQKGTGKTAGEAAGRAAAGAADKAAGATIGSSVPIVGTIIGAVVGTVASKLTDKFGPKAIKWTFYILLGIFLALATFAIVVWGILGGGEYFGRSHHTQAQQSTIDKFLAWTGDPAALRKLIVEEGDQLKQELDSAKKSIDSLKIDSNKKEGAKKKIDEAIPLIDEVKALLSGSGTTLSPAAKEKTNKLIALLNDIRNILNFAVSKGDFALPLGSLTCIAGHNRAPHTLAPKGHGVFIKHNEDGGALDYKAPAGSPVYAINDGQITKTGWHKKWHNYVIYFKSEDGRYEAAYAHITREVERGDKVGKGQIIGHLLQGKMKVPHLHFELWINGTPIKEKAQLPFFCEVK